MSCPQQEFNHENRREFFENVFQAKKVNSGKIAETLFEIENFLKTSENSSSSDYFSNPLLLRMIAELFMDNLNFQLADANLYSIFDEFVQKSIEKLYEKGAEAYNDIKDTGSRPLIECYQKKAVYVVLENPKIQKSNFPSLFRKIPELPVHKIVRIPILFDDGFGQLYFVHKTFAEFFVARFLIEKTFGQEYNSEDESDALAALWLKVLEILEFKMIRKFLEGKIAEIGTNAKENSSKNIFENIKKSNSNILNRLAREGCINLIKLASREMIKRKNMFEKWTNCDNVLSLAVACQPFEFVQELWKFAVEIFEPRELKEILLRENQIGQNVLNLAVNYEKYAKSFEFFVAYARSEILNENELERFLTPKHPLWSSWDKDKDSYVKTIIDRCKKNFTENEFERFLMSTDE